MLLLKSVNRTGPYRQKPYWDIPGGRVKEGVSIEEALVEEVEEETGIKDFENRGLFYAAVSNIEITQESCGLVLFIYDCTVSDECKIKLNDENTEYNWFNKNEAIQLLSVKYPADFINKL